MSETALTFQPADFLHSLCRFIVAQAAARTPAVTLNYTDTTQLRQLWRNLIPDANAADPALVARNYGGPPLQAASPLPRTFVQIQSEGTNDDAVSTLIQTAFEAFVDGTGKPARMMTINGYLAADDSANGTYLIVNADPLQRPGMISRDDRGRSTYGFNLELGFMKAS